MTHRAYRNQGGEPDLSLYKVGFFMKPSEARAMASAILSAATEAKG